MNYRLIDHTADIGIRAWGSTLEDLFIHAAEGMLDVMLEDWASPSEGNVLRVVIEAEDIERLLVKWLQKLLYEFDANRTIANQLEIVKISPTALEADATFANFDSTRHTLKTELKAVTYHQLSVRQTSPTRFEAQVIFDV